MKIKFPHKILFSGIILLLIFGLFVFAKCKADEPDIDVKLEITTETEIFEETDPETEDDTDFIDDETEEDDLTDDITDDAKETKPRATYPSDYGQPQVYYSFVNGGKCTRSQQRKRPVSIIIGNSRDANPTVGLGRADIIYECMVEGGITRLMMVLTNYDDIPVAGGVRSSREYFIDLSCSHNTIYVHAGGNEQDYWEFSKRKIDRMDGVNMYFPNTFYRDAKRRQTMALEHTLMTSGDGIIAGIDQAKYDKKLSANFKGSFHFYEKFTDIGGRDNTANYIRVPFSAGFKPEFIYNQDDQLYYRKQYGAAHIDGETGEQLRFENVIVLFAEYSPKRDTPTQKKEGHFYCELTGTGYGFYITQGKYKIIRWSKETRESIMYLYNMDKSDLLINPGKSFVCVTSTAYNKSVVINDDIRNVK